jgi:cysteinyl-tRNA synthetase
MIVITHGETAMNDRDFSELQLRMMIVPHQVRWPAPEYLHWQRLHEAADEARERVSKAYARMDEIDRNPNLTREEKERQRRKAWAEAIADFGSAKTLARARQAVELAVAKHNIEPEDRDAALRALKEAEAGWQRAVDKIGERASLAKVPIIRR